MAQQTITQTNYNFDALLAEIKRLYGDDKDVRNIQVPRLPNGKKGKPIGRGKMTYEDMISGRPEPIGSNTKELYMPCYKSDNNKLICIDIDEKNDKVYNSDLYKYLNTLDTINCETNGGYHYYVNVTNVPTFSNEVKVSNEDIDIDIISEKRPVWEPYERKFKHNKIVTVDWTDIIKYLNKKKLNIRGEDTNETNNVETVPDIVDAVDVPKATLNEIVSYLDRLSQKRYTYDDFVTVGIVLYNNFEGDSTGFELWVDWVKKDKYYKTDEGHKKRDQMYLAQKWMSFQGESDQKLSYKTLRFWADEDSPMNKYEAAWKIGQNRKDSELSLVKCLNREIAWLIETSEYLLKYDDKWTTKKKADLVNHFENQGFFIKKDDSDDDDKKEFINPFEIWRSHEDRLTYLGIVFDPTKASPGYFNIWDNYAMTREGLKDVDIEEATEKIQPIIDHIKNVWCRGNEAHTDYVLNWLAMKLQKPAEKIAVVIALQSKEGAGKNVVLDKFEHILGSRYHATVSNINQLVGDFNGFTEGKMFMVLDELTFGGDHKTNNKLKNLITDDHQVVNKKNKEAYKIDNYCDYFITTNMSHFVGVTETSRRYFCLQLDNKWAGVDTTEKKSYFNKIRAVENEYLAKYLYERDISTFNPREFDRTDLLQRQVERSWKSDIKYIYKILETKKLSKEPLVKYNKESFGMWGHCARNGKFYYRLDDLFSMYVKADLGAYAQCVPMKDFEETLNDVFAGEIHLGQHNGYTVVSLPDIDVARQCFNNNQQFNYTWGEAFEEIIFSDDSESDSDSE